MTYVYFLYKNIMALQVVASRMMHVREANNGHLLRIQAGRVPSAPAGIEHAPEAATT
jgi:hypothetical protein